MKVGERGRSCRMQNRRSRGHRTRLPGQTADWEVSKTRAPCSPRLWRLDEVPYVSIGSNFGFLAPRDAFLCSAICRRRGARKISRPTPSESCSRRASIAHLRVGGGKSWYGFARPQSWGCALVGTGSRRQYPGPVTPALLIGGGVAAGRLTERS